MESALSGVKVLDLSMNLPGPYMTWLLAVMGADVVKVENPERGDYARMLAGRKNSPYFSAVNRNKKSLALNLKHPEGRDIFLRLLNVYDVVVEGFRPGTMDRFGLGYNDVASANPRVIYVSISGYGQDGPYRLRAGHDINYLALAGILGMTGARDGSLAVPGIQVADLAGGSLMALVGLLAALVHREKTGEGQYIDTSMFHGAFSLATMVFAGIDQGLEEPRPTRMLLNGRFPCYGLYRTADGAYMSLGALEYKFWDNFCQAVGRTDLLPEQFGGPEAVAAVQAVFGSRSRAEWVELLKEVDACCEPVLTLDEAADSDLVMGAGMICRRADGRFLGSPFRLSKSPPPTDVPAPALGEHTREILGQLGVGQDELEKLYGRGVVC